MSTHEHTICDGCGEEMDGREYGRMSGAVGFTDHGYLAPGQDAKHFHNPKCLARFAEIMHNKIEQKQIRVTIEELGESG